MLSFNPTALRKPKVVYSSAFLSAIGLNYNVCLSECKRVKRKVMAFLSVIGLNVQFWSFCVQ